VHEREGTWHMADTAGRSASQAGDWTTCERSGQAACIIARAGCSMPCAPENSIKRRAAAMSDSPSLAACDACPGTAPLAATPTICKKTVLFHLTGDIFTLVLRSGTPRHKAHLWDLRPNIPSAQTVRILSSAYVFLIVVSSST
jgi:hypothetical protein